MNWKWSVIGLFLLTGCPRPVEVRVNPAEETSQAKNEVLEDALFLYFSAGTPMGTERRTLDQTETGLEHHTAVRLTLRRFGETVSSTMLHDETLNMDGTLRSFDTRIQMGGSTIQHTACVVNGIMQAGISTFGRTENRALRLPNLPVLGAYAAEVSLLQAPMKLGETRTLVHVEPSLLTWVQKTLTCQAAEDVTRPNGEVFPLHRILVVSKLLAEDGSTTALQEETFWCDGVGKIWKKESPLLEMTAWRVSAEEAEAFAHHAGAGNMLDVGRGLSVPLESTGQIPDLSQANEVEYLVRSTSEKVFPAEILKSSTFQQVTVVDPTTVRVQVLRSLPGNCGVFPVLDSDKPTPEDSAANSLIQSDAPEVQALAAQAAGEETAPSLALAKRLERFVYSYITDKNYARGFVTAAEVVAQPSGDCTEHAVLLAALARACRIPTRVTQGLIFVPGADGEATENGRFVWHVWNECWLDGIWIPLDATQGEGVVGADHLRINAGNFDSQTLAVTLAPITRLVGKLEIHWEPPQETP